MRLLLQSIRYQQALMQQLNQRKYVKKMFEIANSVGKLHIQVNAFQKYYFVVVTYLGLLKIDQGIQVVHPTPYNPHPTMLNITPECELIGESISRRLVEQLKCPMVVSLNVELNMNKKGEEELLAALLQILSSMRQ